MLEKGDKIPELTLPDQDGNDVKLSDLYRDQKLVLFFYPKDNSFGCTRQACSFRDEYHVFEDNGAEVVGVSSDDQDSHRTFIEEHNLPFPLLSDVEGKAKEAFGVSDTFGLIPGRATFVVDEDGTILKSFESQFQFSRHAEEALELIA